jgi:hypothetical protein
MPQRRIDKSGSAFSERAMYLESFGRRNVDFDGRRLDHDADAAELSHVRPAEAEHSEVQPARCVDVNAATHP